MPISKILGGLSDYVGRGGVISASQARADEGTTYEASCYTDSLAIEHLTGCLPRQSLVSAHGTRRCNCASRQNTTISIRFSPYVIAIAHASGSQSVALRWRALKAALPACLRASTPCGARRSQVIRLGLRSRRSCRKVIGAKLISSCYAKLLRLPERVKTSGPNTRHRNR